MSSTILPVNTGLRTATVYRETGAPADAESGTGGATGSSGASNAPLTTALEGPGGKLGKMEFLKLLTTQLRYQDPMNPLEGQEVAADLAQFSALEQMVNIAEAVEAQKAAQAQVLTAVNNSVAISTIGKTVTAAGNSVVLTEDKDGLVSGKVNFRVHGKGEGSLKVYDASGKLIATKDLGELKDGLQSADIDSSVSDKLKEGTYTYAVEVKSGSKAVDVTTYTTVKVDGISYGEGGAVLTAGPIQIPIGSILKIEN